MAAESGGGELLKVLGEYGVFLVEMGSLKDIYGAARASSRIKYNCLSVGKKFIAVGASSGGLYLYYRKTLEYFRLIATKDGQITKVCFAKEKNYVGFATSSGIVIIVDIGSRTRDKPKYLRRSEEHKGATVTCLCWDDSDSRLFASDDQGVVSALYLPNKYGTNPSQSKRSLIKHGTSIVGKSETAINQIDYAVEKLLVSTMTKTAVLDLPTLQCWLVGSKPREGYFGACFLQQFNQYNATIYTARPGSRLWEASMDGQVISTQQYKHLLAVPSSPVLGHSHDVLTSQSNEEDCKPKSINFSKLLLIRERFLLTWMGSDLFLLDPVLGQVVGWYHLDTAEISDVCCYGNQFYVYHADGHMTWFGILTVKETVARLFELDDFRQCAAVALQCKSYLIPGTARDWVPVSMVTSLVTSLQGQQETEELVNALQELQQSLQEDTTLCLEKPPGFYGDDSVIDSPETMSINSDVASHHMDSGLEDDDNLSVNQEAKNKDGEFSLENALFSVASKARRFAEERRSKRKFNFPAFRRTSADSEGQKPSDEKTELQQSQQGTFMEELGVSSDLATLDTRDDPSNKFVAKDVVQQEVDSDNESKGDDDALDVKKVKEKVRRKKKKKVVTVDINTPKTDKKTNNTTSQFVSIPKVKRSNSEWDSPVSPIVSPRLNDVPSELPPAIPAMLSKAREVIKRKLKETGTEHQNFTRTQSLPAELKEEGTGIKRTASVNKGEVRESEEEEEVSVEIPCPAEVEELRKTTVKVREQVHSPQILLSRHSLHNVLQGWIPGLFNALQSLNSQETTMLYASTLDPSTSPFANEQDSTPTLPNKSKTQVEMMKNLLGEETFNSVCLLTKMCFDCEVYCSSNDKKATECDFENVTRNAASNSHSSSGVHLKQHEKKPEDVGDDNSLKEKVDKEELEKKLCSSERESQEEPLLYDNSSLNEKIRDENNTKQGADCYKSTDDSQKDCSQSKTTSHNAENLFSERKTDSWKCNICTKSFNSEFQDFLSSSLSKKTNESDIERDSNRAAFIRNCFMLLRVCDMRSTLGLKQGIKTKTWEVLLDCLKEFSESDDVSHHIKDGHVTRALHVLHDGIQEYQDVLLLHLTNLYEKNGRETVNTCARMYPDVLPWEVMEMCRQGRSHDPQASAQYFMYYVEQLLRWRTNLREKRPKTIKALLKDTEFAIAWFHNALVASNPVGQQHCQCGLPRPGSHRLLWKHEDHFQEILDFVLEKCEHHMMDLILDMCWKHGYWPGFIRVCSRKGYKQLVLQTIVCLGDTTLLESSYGPTLQSLDEWKVLLELVISHSKHIDYTQSCDFNTDSDWMPDMTWEKVAYLALKQLGASRLIPLLNNDPFSKMSLPVEFYYKCILGVIIEKEQSKRVHDMLTTVDTYLWSKRAGVLTPQMNFARLQEQNASSEKVIPPAEVSDISQHKTLEDSATNWGVNIHLAEASCPVCTLQLGEQVSSSNQGLLVFECGHVFHKFCVPEHACVVCFNENLRTIGKPYQLTEQSPSKIE